ncbi:helix-turn-helix transcriptional regulator [Oricola nitratireducens]|uniref:helix-turn-helix transcriptional regulator n=1 Tax=Oricola nitratireducens TaxID=2775868 RepID=UPI001FEDBAD4|nr:LuxR C-terminal-related transcriptional regulator [Oricola nitratireducens]
MATNDALADSADRKLIGMAVEDDGLTDEIRRTLSSSSYALIRFTKMQNETGHWPGGDYYCVLADTERFHNYRCQLRPDMSRRIPVVLILDYDELPLQRQSLMAADTFAVADRNLHRLPSIIRLSRYRLGLIVSPADLGHVCVNEKLSILNDLQDRERMVLVELSRGSANSQIASRLNLTVSNVKERVRQIIDHFGFRNRTDAGLFAAAFLADDPALDTPFDGPTRKES